MYHQIHVHEEVNEREMGNSVVSIVRVTVLCSTRMSVVDWLLVVQTRRGRGKKIE